MFIKTIAVPFDIVILNYESKTVAYLKTHLPVGSRFIKHTYKCYLEEAKQYCYDVEYSLESRKEALNRIWAPYKKRPVLQ